MATQNQHLPDLERQAQELVESMESYRSAAAALQAATDAMSEAQGRLDSVENRAKDVLAQTQRLASELEGIDPAGLFVNLESTFEENAERSAELASKLIKSLEERQATARELVDGLTRQYMVQSAALLKTFQDAVNSGIVATQVHEAFAPQFGALERQLHAQRQQVEYLQQKTFTVIKEEISGVRTSVYDATVGGGLSTQVKKIVSPRLDVVEQGQLNIGASLSQINASHADLREGNALMATSIRATEQSLTASNRLISDELVPLRLSVERQGRLIRCVLVAIIVLGVLVVIAALV